MGGKSSQSSSTTSVPPEVLEQYRNVTARANNAVDAPLQQYQGQMVASFNPQQQQAFGQINNAQGIAAPYYQQAGQYLNDSNRDLMSNVPQFNAENLNKYMSPYTDSVVNSTMRNMQENNAQQQQSLRGNAISSGAWGGDRAGVASAELSRQQNLADNQTIAGLRNQAYSQGLGEFNQQQGFQYGANQAQNQQAGQAAQLAAGLGQSNLASYLTGTNALMQSGAMRQAQNQQGINAAMQQFNQKQQYPFQTTGWLANIAEGIGSNSGGTRTDTQPDGNSLSSGIGSALAVASMFMNRGGRAGYADGGIVIPELPDFWKEILAGQSGSHGGGPMSVQSLMSAPPLAPPKEDNSALNAGIGMMGKSMMPSSSGMIGSAGLPAGAKNLGYETPWLMNSPLPTGATGLGGMMPWSGFADGGEVDDESPFGTSPLDADPFNAGIAAGTDEGASPMSAAALMAPSAPIATPAAAASDFTPPSGLQQAPAAGLPIQQPDSKQALLAAGLAMMAGKSPHALQNIGTGGLEGVKAYEQQKQLASAYALKQQQAQALQQYRQDMAATRKTTAENEAKRLADTADYHKQQIEQGKYSSVPGTGKDENGETVPGTYVMNAKTGDMEFRPGVVTGKMATSGPVGSGAPTKEFGFDQGALARNPQAYKKALETSEKRTQVYNSNNGIAKNMLRYADEMEPALDKFQTGFGGEERLQANKAARLGQSTFPIAGDLAAPFIGSEKEHAEKAQAGDIISKNANNLVAEASKFEYVPGQRGSVLYLKTLQGGKPGLTPEVAVNKSILNDVRAKAYDSILSEELAQRYKQASPLRVIDDGANRIYDALAQKYPLQSNEGEFVKFHPENVAKIRAEMPDAIANPQKYGVISAGMGTPEPAAAPAPQSSTAAPEQPMNTESLNSQANMPEGAKLAPDGNYYLPDPNRPGKYLLVKP